MQQAVLAHEVAALHGAPQDHEQLVLLERLREVVEGALAHGLHRAVDGAVGGHEHDAQAGLHREQLRQEGDAVHVRHLEVGEDHVERLLARNLERLPGVARRCGLVALGVEDHLQDVALVPLVVDDEHAALHRRDGFQRGRPAPAGGAQGQRDAHRRASSGRRSRGRWSRRGPPRSCGSGRGRGRRRPPWWRSTARRPCGSPPRVMPWPVSVTTTTSAPAPFVLPAAHRAGEQAPLGHGVEGVDHQVEEARLQQLGVGHDRWESLLALDDECDALVARLVVDQGRHLAQHLLDGARARIEAHGLAEGEEVPHQAVEPADLRLHVAQDAVEILAARRVLRAPCARAGGRWRG